jgi:hypothetical protein
MNVTAIINYGWPGFMLRALSAFNDGDDLQAYLDTQVEWADGITPPTAAQVDAKEVDYLAHVISRQEELAAKEGVSDQVAVDPLIVAIRSMTPEEHAAWVEANVTADASVKMVLTKLITSVAVMADRVYEG